MSHRGILIRPLLSTDGKTSEPVAESLSFSFHSGMGGASTPTLVEEWRAHSGLAKILGARPASARVLYSTAVMLRPRFVF